MEASWKGALFMNHCPPALPCSLFSDPQWKKAASLEILICCLFVKRCHCILYIFLDMQINVQMMLSGLGCFLKQTEIAQNFAAKWLITVQKQHSGARSHSENWVFWLISELYKNTSPTALVSCSDIHFFFAWILFLTEWCLSPKSLCYRQTSLQSAEPSLSQAFALIKYLVT